MHQNNIRSHDLKSCTSTQSIGTAGILEAKLDLKSTRGAIVVGQRQALLEVILRSEKLCLPEPLVLIELDHGNGNALEPVKASELAQSAVNRHFGVDQRNLHLVARCVKYRRKPHSRHAIGHDALKDRSPEFRLAGLSPECFRAPPRQTRTPAAGPADF